MTTKVTNIYNLKLTPSQFGQNSIVVNCSQYDSLFRVIQFNLYNGNAVYSIPDGSVVTIRGTKKDNTGFETILIMLSHSHFNSRSRSSLEKSRLN